MVSPIVTRLERDLIRPRMSAARSAPDGAPGYHDRDDEQRRGDEETRGPCEIRDDPDGDNGGDCDERWSDARALSPRLLLPAHGSIVRTTPRWCRTSPWISSSPPTIRTHPM